MIFRHICFAMIATFSSSGSIAFCAQADQAQVKLEYKFPEGRTLAYKTTSRVRQVMTFMGTQIESVKRETKEWSRSVGKRRGDSTLAVEEKVQSLRVDYTLPGGIKLSLDSRNPNIKIDNKQLAFLGEVFELESTIAYLVIVDKDIKVKAIEWAEKLREQVEKLADPIAREEFENEISADRLKVRFEQEVHRLPDVGIRSGEPWERTELLEINGKSMSARKKYEYGGTEKKGDRTVEKISAKVLEVKYDMDRKDALPLKVVKNDLKVESSDGTILFDRENGYVVSASERVRMKGEISLSGAGVEQSGEINLTFECETQLQPPAK